MEHVSLCFRVKNSKALHRTFNVDPLYLQYDKKGIIDHYDSCNSLHTKLKEIVYPYIGLAIDFMVCCLMWKKACIFKKFLRFFFF